MKLPEIQFGEGLKSFAAEVGIVTLGVVIALALGEWVESWNWSARRAEARAALQEELSGAAASAIERQRTAGCLQRRLAQVLEVIDQGTSSGRLPGVSNFPMPAMRPWRTTAWETVVASQTASRFPVQSLNKLASAYQTIAQMRSWNIDEKEAWTALSLLNGAGRPLTPQLEIYLRDAHAKAEYFARVMAIAASQLTRDIAQTGIRVEVPAPRRRPLGPNSTVVRVCRPMVIGAA